MNPAPRRMGRPSSEGFAAWVLLVLAVALGMAAAKPLHTVPLIPHHVQVERRLKEFGGSPSDYDRPTGPSRRAEALQVGGLYHGYGTHYADVWVGTPPQRQTVIVDTGSSITAFPCGECNDCGYPTYHIDNYFDYDSSETFHKLACNECDRGHCDKRQQCKLSMSYQEGSSWYAFEARDTTYVGGPHNVALLDDPAASTEDIDPNHASHFAFPMTFGCQYRLTGLFKTQLADGIMGMDYERTSFWHQLHDSGNMGDDKKFSLCFSHPKGASREGTEAGAMTFGGTETRLHKDDMVYTRKSTGSGVGFFNVRVRKVYLRHGDGGEGAKSSNPDAEIIQLDVNEYQLNSGGVIVDSGTTDTYWDRQISTAFRSAYQELSGRAFTNHDENMTEEEAASLPTILFQLFGDEDRNKAINEDPNQVSGLAGDLDPDHPYDVILALPPSHYLEHLSSGKWSMRFYDTENGESVIGANTMTGHDVLFDADNLQIGWAESDCDYQKLVTDAGYTDVLEATEIDAVPETTSTEEEEETTQEEEEETEEPTQQEEEEEEEKETTPEEKEEESIPEEEAPDSSAGSSEGSDTKDAQKKDHPSEGSHNHEDQSPVNDLKVAADGFRDACDSSACRGAVGLTILVALSGVFYCLRCLGKTGRRRGAYKPAQQRPELELSNAFQINYRDEDEGYADDPTDAEYGDFEFETKGRIS